MAHQADHSDAAAKVPRGADIETSSQCRASPQPPLRQLSLWVSKRCKERLGEQAANALLPKIVEVQAVELEELRV